MNKEKEEICYLCLNKGYIDKSDISRLDMEGVFEQEDCNCKFSLKSKIKENADSLIDILDNGKMVRGYEKLFKLDEEKKKKKTELIIKTVFITLLFPTTYILLIFVGENKIIFPNIIPAFTTTSLILSVIYLIVFRIFIGKIDRNKYGDYSLIWFPIFLFGGIMISLLAIFTSLNFHDYNFEFLIKYRAITLFIFVFIVSFIITKKIYWFVFNKKEIGSDSKN